MKEESSDNGSFRVLIQRLFVSHMYRRIKKPIAQKSLVTSRKYIKKFYEHNYHKTIGYRLLTLL